MVYLLLAIYLLCTVGGLTLLKIGGGGNDIVISNSIVNLKISITTLLGLLLYIISFALWTVLIQRFNLSYIFPIATGLAYLLVIASSLLVLKEVISPFQWSGLVFILIGVILMNIKS